MKSGFDFMAAINNPPAEASIPPPAVIGINDSDQACQVLRRTYLPEIERMKAQALAHVVTDEASQNEAITMAGQAKKLANAIEKKRKEVIEAPGEFVKTVNNFVKVFRDTLDEIDRKLKAGIQTHMTKVQMEQREAQERARIEAEKIQRELDARAAALNAQREAEARKAAEKGEPAAPMEPEVIAPVVVAPVVPVQKVFRSETGSSVHLRKDWVWDVLDISLIPPKYLVVDKVAVNQAVKSGIREIPGMRIYETESAIIKA
jgi:hypothetical protein